MKSDDKLDQPDLGGVVYDDNFSAVVRHFITPATIPVNRQVYEAAAHNARAENRDVNKIVETALRRYNKAAQRRAINRELLGQLELFPELALPPFAAFRKPRSSRFPKALMPKRKRRDEAPTGSVDTFEPFLVYEHEKSVEGDGDDRIADDNAVGDDEGAKEPASIHVTPQASEAADDG